MVFRLATGKETDTSTEHSKPSKHTTNIMKKKILLALIAIAGLFSTTAVADNSLPINFEQLPIAAQNFIKKHFKAADVATVLKDKELLSVSYDVIMEDGTTVEFDKKGNWNDVDGKHKAIPTAIVPAAILQYVQKNYPKQYIVQLERNSNGRYEVELNNDLSLKFNSKFRLVSVDH